MNKQLQTGKNSYTRLPNNGCNFNKRRSAERDKSLYVHSTAIKYEVIPSNIIDRLVTPTSDGKKQFAIQFDTDSDGEPMPLNNGQSRETRGYPTRQMKRVLTTRQEG